MFQHAKIIIIIDNILCCFQKVCTNLYYSLYCRVGIIQVRKDLDTRPFIKRASLV